MKHLLLTALLLVSLLGPAFAGSAPVPLGGTSANLPPPVRHANLEFRASSETDRAGIVEVWNVSTGLRVGDILVYRTELMPIVATDVRLVSIKKLKLKWPMLTVVDSQGKTYKLRADEYTEVQ